jgi:molybdate transport system permease protein
MVFKGDPAVIGILLFSGRIVLTACLMNLILGTGTGVWLALNRESRLSGVIETIATLPLVFPPVGLGFFLIILFGRNGIIGRGLDNIFNINLIFSSTGVLLAAFIAGFPLMLKSVQTSALSLNKSILEMAAIQGADKAQILRLIILPNIRTGILSGLTLTAARSLGEVGVTLMLGGNIRGKTETISLAIYNAVLEGDYHRAYRLSFLLAGLSIILFTLLQRSQNNEYER